MKIKIKWHKEFQEKIYFTENLRELKLIFK